MPFGNIIVPTGTFEPRANGIYQLSGISFGQPTNEFRIRPAGSPGKDGLIRGSIIRVFEKDIEVGSTIMRAAAISSLNLASPLQNFSGDEIDAMVADISAFTTAGIISRIFSGEQ